MSINVWKAAQQLFLPCHRIISLLIPMNQNTITNLQLPAQVQQNVAYQTAFAPSSIYIVHLDTHPTQQQFFQNQANFLSLLLQMFHRLAAILRRRQQMEYQLQTACAKASKAA